MDPSKLVKPVLDIVRQSALEVMRIYQNDQILEVKPKINQTPLTQADLLSHEIIQNGLNQLTPEIPVLSEEGGDIPFQDRQKWGTYWLVDPLDGTKEFIRHSGEFCINVALIQDHQPILGVLFSPTTMTCYTACQQMGARFLDQQGKERSLHVTPWPSSTPVRVIVSHSTVKEPVKVMCDALEMYHLQQQGSAIKFGIIAQGDAELYPRFGPISEWDTAAGQCILECAGGAVLDLEGNALRYNTKDPLLLPPFIAVSDRSIGLKLLQNWR